MRLGNCVIDTESPSRHAYSIQQSVVPAMNVSARKPRAIRMYAIDESGSRTSNPTTTAATRSVARALRAHLAASSLLAAPAGNATGRLAARAIPRRSSPGLGPRRSFSTSTAASRAIATDIFDSPTVRSRKTIGISFTRPPARTTR